MILFAAALLVAPVESTPRGTFAHFHLQGRLEQGGLVRGIVPRGTTHLSWNGAPIPFSGDGGFLLGLDRDAAAQGTLVAEAADGTRTSLPLVIAPRAWRIERLDIPRRPSAATPDYLKLREGEVARIADARRLAADSDGWRRPFVWPARGRISGVFGSQRFYRGEAAAYHSGTDIAAGPGAPVVAPADGVVVLAGPPAFSLEGNLVIVDHGMGLNSAFLHLASSNVRVGQRLRQGDLIGTVGATGRATGPHLHWSVKWNDARLDPQVLVLPAP